MESSTKKAVHYRQRAASARANANDASSPAIRNSYLKMAEEYEALAITAEAMEGRLKSHI
jgi:hypothetical protein